MKSDSNTRAVGSNAEDIAESFLRDLGYRIIKRNFQFGKVGELDIICCDADMLVFVEVKSRSNSDYGRPEDSITPRKQKQMRAVAKGYLHVNGLLDVQCRFDVIAIDESGATREIRHWINAFW